jgi:hypothetical protein
MLTYEEKLNRDLTWALEEGGMHFERRSEVHETLQRLTRSLNELGIDYAVAGAMAMFLHGFRRFTEDVDILVTREGLQEIHTALEGRGYLPVFEKSKNLRDTQSGVKIDFLISGQYPGEGKAGPVAFPVPQEASIELDGIRVLVLPKLLELKLASGQAAHRRRDLADAQQLIQVLELPQEFSTKLDCSVRGTFLELWKEAQVAKRDEY